jgi:hypothetical protein
MTNTITSHNNNNNNNNNNRDNAGASDMGTINSSDRIAATLYSLGTWFVSGIYVNTLHKGDSIFTNNNNNNNKTATGLSPDGSGYFTRIQI